VSIMGCVFDQINWVWGKSDIWIYYIT
jgi:hypothetical protein